jgi:aminomethyltransferase
MSHDSRLLETPFHTRTSLDNSSHAWSARGGFVVPAMFGSTAHEAVAARHSAVMGDLTPLGRLWLRGENLGAFLRAAFAVDLATIADGEARAVFWKTDRRAMRSSGVLARFSATTCMLATLTPDVGWFAAAAPRFGVTLFDETRHRGVLFLAGAAAARILADAGLRSATQFESMQQGMMQWRGKTVTVSRWLSRFGFEITCSAGDAAEIFDLLRASGRQHGLVLAGQAAIELLMLEQGTAASGLLFPPLRDDGAEPSAAWSGSDDEAGSIRVAAGMEWDGDGSERPRFVFRAPAAAGRTQEFPAGGNDSVGEILHSAYSPALRRMIGVAMIDRALTAPGTQLYLQRIGHAGVEDVPARVVARPFLP